MKTDTWLSVEMYPEEEVCVQALIHTSLSLEFATGAFYVQDCTLYWPIQYTGRLIGALHELRSFKDRQAAYRLYLRIEAARAIF